MAALLLTNATLILEDEVVKGTVLVDGDRIVAVDQGASSRPGAIDLEGDYLCAGLIEMHTDNAEKHFEPRPGVIWPDPLAAILAHDAQMAASGVTTVYDSICAGYDTGQRKQLLASTIAAVDRGVAIGVFRIEHRLHIRCELTGCDLIEQVAPYTNHSLVQLISLMDHTPGQRQWRDLDALRRFHVGSGRRTPVEHDLIVAELMAEGPTTRAKNIPAILELFAHRDVPIASHDDTTEADVIEACAIGAAISEFPTTLDAARAAKARGMITVGGAPNVVRNGSHSGGAAMSELYEAGVLDGLSSDYVPSSLLQAALTLASGDHLKLPPAMALVTCNIARGLGLSDRGRIAAGLRADLVRFRVVDGTPVVRGVWSAGQRAS